MNRITISVNLR